MEQLRKDVAAYVFTTQEEEIHFFKDEKPLFYSKLIYFLKIYRIETRRPTGSNETQQKYLQKELRRLTHYFEENLQFYQYYRSGSTYLDEKYFLRGREDIYLTLDTYHFDADPNFSTSHDFRVAKIHAHELLRIYLIGALEDLERKDDVIRVPASTRQPLAWTASKTALIELLYALQSTGVFNNGAADIKLLATYFEQMFSIDLGNYYRIFQEIRIRKGSRAAFLESLAEKLVQRMDDSDENPKQYL
ncbi:RteC domain-containing protein [Pinibacter soli]|uniref:RteC domain-containing protein n=1 Tax=Pinibacter soli TaxID=3044211 RepID=A0ABT6RFP6_9BACT|nr:RteC domain-containing protein [Pinibacter soli]MDI3321370.1 RteC domain-containing protein [Pinibacter soli]